MNESPIRILIAKPGLDGHDRGARVVARALRDAGMEVIYTGLRQSPSAIVTAAIEEDVDAIGLSSLSGAHDHFFREVIRLLADQGADDILVVAGGIIPRDEAASLKGAGIAEIFGPGTSTKDIIDYLRQAVEERRQTAGCHS
ncbi:MAG: cobalamin B12-binding domain-containing protein [Thermaerobacterales bacterium]